MQYFFSLFLNIKHHIVNIGFVTLKGAVSKGQLGPVELVSQYLRYGEVDEAIGILSCMNWNSVGQQCYTCMSAIVNLLLRQKLTPEKEGNASFSSM